MGVGHIVNISITNCSVVVIYMETLAAVEMEGHRTKVNLQTLAAVETEGHQTKVNCTPADSPHKLAGDRFLHTQSSVVNSERSRAVTAVLHTPPPPSPDQTTTYNLSVFSKRSYILLVTRSDGLHCLPKLKVMDLRHNRISTSNGLGHMAANYNSFEANNLGGNTTHKEHRRPAPIEVSVRSPTKPCRSIISRRPMQRPGSELHMASLQDEHDLEASQAPEYCIDAGSVGNIARFINHSCQPNLFIQCVLSSHRDIKLAKIMLFAADTIPPLQELAYDYGYCLDSIIGADGNVVKLACHCGASDCRKWLY